MTNNLKIDILELPKIEGKENVDDELLDWLYFLVQPKGERVIKKMEENEALKEAVVELETMSENEELRRLADLRLKGERDEKSRLLYAEEKGETRGIQIGEKRGETRGIQIGEERGLKKGREKGKTERNKEIAKKMLLEKMPIETIEKITGLTKEEIEKLK